MTFNPESSQTSVSTNPSPATVPRIWALVPCAGSGSRAGTAVAKQYELIAGLPMVRHTLTAFAHVPSIAATLVVVAPDDHFLDSTPFQHTSKALKAGDAVDAGDARVLNPNATFIVANCGGRTRANSVFNGLNHLITLGATENDWVLVHDAARCLVTGEQISALIEACQPDSVGGLLALKLADTLKSESAGRVQSTVDRSDKWLAQTPQMFRIGQLIQALANAGDTVTDESSAMELMGFSPKLVPGSAQNFKVTYPEDFALAEAVLLARRPLAGQQVTTPTSTSKPISYDYP